MEAFIACKLIPLNKNPGLRPIGVWEVINKDVLNTARSQQVCTGQEAGAEATIRAMYGIYNHEHSKAVLLVDAENAFNSINRNVM